MVAETIMTDAMVTSEIVTYAIVTTTLVTDAIVAFLLVLEELKDLQPELQVRMPKWMTNHMHNHSNITTLHQLQYTFLQICQHDN